MHREFKNTFDFPSKFYTRNQLKCDLHVLHAVVGSPVSGSKNLGNIVIFNIILFSRIILN